MIVFLVCILARSGMSGSRSGIYVFFNVTDTMLKSNLCAPGNLFLCLNQEGEVEMVWMHIS